MRIISKYSGSYFYKTYDNYCFADSNIALNLNRLLAFPVESVGQLKNVTLLVARFEQNSK